MEIQLWLLKNYIKFPKVDIKKIIQIFFKSPVTFAVLKQVLISWAEGKNGT